MSSSSGPFTLEIPEAGSLARAVVRMSAPLVESLLAIPALNQAHKRIRELPAKESFAARSLRALNVKVDVDESATQRVPKTGPLVVVANHPFGGIDGLALLALLQRRRPDVKILANHLLARVPELRDSCFFVDPFGGSGAVARNLGSVRQALRWVKRGGALAVFPAGEVSRLTLRDGEVSDGAWSSSVARLIRATGASVLPVFFAGRNSAGFQIAGLLSPWLRTAMLPRELLKKRGSTLCAQIGNVIPAEKLKQFESDEGLASYLRVRTYLLAGRDAGPAKPQAGPRRSERREDVAAPEDTAGLAAEVAHLEYDQTLAKSGSLSVCIAVAGQIPVTLREIGRLRELTFRTVGEGTGKARDLDRFDDSYLHLFVWDDSSRRVIGAYRLGLTDRILESTDKDGLYTHTLFNYRDELLEQIGPAIELGRSFVRREHQKEYAPLMLLWKGIALFIARNPRYKNLLGPVTISNDYRSITKQLLIEFLKINTAAGGDLQKLVSPRNPPRLSPDRSWPARLAGTIVRSIEGIDELVGEIESDRLGVPVLLRQYLKLNAKLLGFNVDPDFGDALDGLMLCDLTQVEPAVLVRYMGRDNAAAFLAFHGKSIG